jgi:hypothetical protein
MLNAGGIYHKSHHKQNLLIDFSPQCKCKVKEIEHKERAENFICCHNKSAMNIFLA